MSWFVFLLGLILSLAGAAALIASVDLLTIQIGMIYAIAGAVAVGAGSIILAIGALIRRVDALGRRTHGPEPVFVEGGAPLVDPPAPEAYEEPAPLVEAADEPINENRTGHLPSLAGIEHALHEPEAAPTLVGRYTSGGAHYMIFSDGSIEAETDQGAFKFPSMSAFKAHLANKRG
jgi:hypothetical protein